MYGSYPLPPGLPPLYQLSLSEQPPFERVQLPEYQSNDIESCLKIPNYWTCEHRAQIFKKVDVKLYYIFLLINLLDRNFGSFAINLPWQFFDIMITFRMAAFINFEAVTSSNC